MIGGIHADKQARRLVEDLHIKYRPTKLGEIVGHEAEVKSLLRKQKAKTLPHVFLFTGPAGVGKTTLARIIANIKKAELIEIDAATYSGINDMRQLADSLYYKSLKPGGRKCVVVDEAHGLSKQAWQSLLKIAEEPPEHVYFCFCTTEAEKVPKTIKTRAHTFNLKPITASHIEGMLVKVAEAEGIGLDEEALHYIARKAEGSAREALVFLSQCRDAESMEEVKELVEQAGAEAQYIELFRMLVSGRATWAQCLKIVTSAEVGSYESLRIGLVNYVAAVLLKRSKNPEGLLAVLEAFSSPFNKSTEKAEFLLALGTCTLEG